MSNNGKPNPRADSFSLYCNWVANRVLISLLQKNYLSSKIHRTLKTKAMANSKVILQARVAAGSAAASPFKKILKNQEITPDDQSKEEMKKTVKPR